MVTQSKTYIPEEEYLEREVLPIPGHTPNQACIVANTILAVGPTVRSKRFRIYAFLQVKVSTAGVYVGPDITAVSGDAQHETDPTLVFEVASLSRDDERGTKFKSYRSIPGFTELVAIMQDEAGVEHYTRQDQFHWQFTKIKGIDQSIDRATLDCDIPLSEIYKDIQFDG